MGSWITVATGIVACLLLRGTGHPVLFWSAVGATAVGFWSFGVMHNYAMQLARARHERLRDNMAAEGRISEDSAPSDEAIVRPTSREIDAVPNWITTVNMLAAVALFGLLVTSIVIRMF